MNVLLHPLSVFSITDHHTRTRLGGSPSPSNAPVIGILYGSYTNANASNKTLSILDAEDVGYELDMDVIRIQIDLHRAVYPNQSVVGWYRVGGDESGGGGVSMRDVEVHKKVQNLCRLGMMEEVEVQVPLVFLFVNSDQSGDQSGDGEFKKDMEEDELPLSIYELLSDDSSGSGGGGGGMSVEDSSGVGGGGGGEAFVEMKFEFKSVDTEIIAMEHLFKKAQEKKDANAYMDVLSSSVGNLQSRMSVLMEYLVAVRSGHVRPNYDLVRRINTLLHMLTACSLSADDEIKSQMFHMQADMHVMNMLATLTKTIQSVQAYNEKSAVVTPNLIMSSSDVIGSTANKSSVDNSSRELFMTRAVNRTPAVGNVGYSSGMGSEVLPL